MFKVFGGIIGGAVVVLAAMMVFKTANVDSAVDKVIAQADKLVQQAVEEAPLEVLPVKTQPRVMQAKIATAMAVLETEALDAVVENVVSSAISEPLAITPETSLAWHIIWPPFKSHRSAQGFANRLSQQTGIELSVLEDSAGEFSVNFSYQDEADKQALLTLIKDKTGLEVLI